MTIKRFRKRERDYFLDGKSYAAVSLSHDPWAHLQARSFYRKLEASYSSSSTSTATTNAARKSTQATMSNFYALTTSMRLSLGCATNFRSSPPSKQSGGARKIAARAGRSRCLLQSSSGDEASKKQTATDRPAETVLHWEYT